MKNYFMGAMVLAGIIFLAAPVTTRAAGLTQAQVQAVLSLLQAFGAEPAVIQNAGKAMGFADTSATTVAPTNTGPKFIVRDIEAKTMASSSTVYVYPEVYSISKYSKPPQAIRQVLTEILGSYELTLEVTAGDEAVSIPKTTTDSVGGATGFSYSLVGQEFKGSQTSSIICSNYGGNKCLIPSGKTKSVRVTVLLNPSESGNYGVSFDKVNYWLGQNTDLQSWKIGKETNAVYVK
jgi:hypothetical protein